MDLTDENPNYNFIDIKPIICFNVVIGITLLLPQWFIIITCYIFVVEGIILNLFLKNWQASFAISLIVNITSALIAMLFEPMVSFLNMSQGDLFSNLINGVQLFLEEGEEYLFFILLLFFFAFIVTILIEVAVSLVLIPPLPERQRLLIFSLANIASYSSLVIFFSSLGFLFTLTTPNQTIGADEFFQGKLFQTFATPTDLVPYLLVLFLFCLLAVVYFIYTRYDPLHLIRSSKK